MVPTNSSLSSLLLGKDDKEMKKSVFNTLLFGARKNTVEQREHGQNEPLVSLEMKRTLE